jgi:hypothetical protein
MLGAVSISMQIQNNSKLQSKCDQDFHLARFLLVASHMRRLEETRAKRKAPSNHTFLTKETSNIDLAVKGRHFSKRFLYTGYIACSDSNSD